MVNFIKSVRYPPDARKKGIAGTVFLKLSFDDQGRLLESSVVKPVHPSLDAEAVRISKMMPNWRPAFYRGKKKATVVVLPVNFKIS